MYLNKINTLLKCTYQQKINLRFLDTFAIHTKLLVNMLGLQEIKAQEYIRQHKLYGIETHRLTDALDFFKFANYSVDDVLETPKLFQQCHSRTWEQYYLVLEQCGCKNITINNLLTFRKIMFTTVTKLKTMKFLPQNHNVAAGLIKYLNPISDDFQINDLTDDCMLKYILYQIIHRYLKFRLEATDEEIECLFRMHRFIYNKSLVYLCENINFALEIGYSKQKILRNGYILNAHPKHTKEVIYSIPDLAGTDMRKQMKLYPKLIGISLQRFLTTYEMLKTSNISDEIIKRSMNVFTLKPSTVKERLNDINKTPEIRVLLHNPRVLSLIVHFHRAKNRLSFLQNLKLKCASLIVLGDHENKSMDNHIKEGKDVNKSPEIGRFLKALLNSDNDQIEVNIKKHPFYLNVPLVEMENTYLFLKRKRFTDKHISKCVQLLLYPVEKITTIIENMKSEKKMEGKVKLRGADTLNIILYFLEKDHHFSGNGIWQNNLNPDETL